MSDLPVAEGWYFLQDTHVSSWYRYYESENGKQYIVAFVSDESDRIIKNGKEIILEKYLCAYRTEIPSDNDYKLRYLYVSDESLELSRLNLDVILAEAGWYVLPGMLGEV